MSSSALPSAARSASFSERFLDWVLSTDPKQRLRITRSLMSALVFFISVGLIAYGSIVGLMDPRSGSVLAGVIALSCTGFYAALRSGWNLRFSDPSLTLPQILAALTWICGAYAITNEGHGGILMLLGLVLVFGIFNMNAQRARLSTLYAVAAMGLTMVYMASTDPRHYPARVEWMHFVIVATVMPMISQLATQLNSMRSKLKNQKRDLEVALERIQELATRDELTGLFNRRQITEVLGEHAARCNRGVVKFWVAVLDLDHFKRINDTWGHGVGDEVLRSFAQMAASVLRETDVIGRWGGEEFLVIMLAVPPHDPVAGLERLRIKLADAQVSQTVPELRVTFSAGMAAYGEYSEVKDAIERADRALYQAKAEGRNRSIMAPDTPSVATAGPPPRRQ
ncbi:MAG TPA: GGDEF domain-containing protein [Aquabacterium sp.]|nr:GGDEF domain-containing protein [Aquabacterium sp.]